MLKDHFHIFRSSWIRYELLNMRMNRCTYIAYLPIPQTLWQWLKVKSNCPRITFRGSINAKRFLPPSWCITQFWRWVVNTKSIDFAPIWWETSIIFSRYNFPPRYFRKSKRISKIETFIRQSKLGDWSVDVNMFLSRGRERGRDFWKYEIDYSELGGKVSGQFRGDCKQSYFQREIKAGRSISSSFTSGRNQTLSRTKNWQK